MKGYIPLLWIVVAYLSGAACGQASGVRLPSWCWAPALLLLGFVGWWDGKESHRFDR